MYTSYAHVYMCTILYVYIYICMCTHTHRRWEHTYNFQNNFLWRRRKKSLASVIFVKLYFSVRDNGIVAKNVNFGARLPGFKTQFCHYYLQGNCITSLCLFLFS